MIAAIATLWTVAAAPDAAHYVTNLHRVPLSGVLTLVQLETEPIQLCVGVDGAMLPPEANQQSGAGLVKALKGQPHVAGVALLEAPFSDDKSVSSAATQKGCTLSLAARHFLQGGVVTTLFTLVDDQGDGIGTWSVDGYLQPRTVTARTGDMVAGALKPKRARVVLPEAFVSNAWTLEGNPARENWKPVVLGGDGKPVPVEALESAAKLVGATQFTQAAATQAAAQQRRWWLAGLAGVAPLGVALGLAALVAVGGAVLGGLIGAVSGNAALGVAAGFLFPGLLSLAVGLLAAALVGAGLGFGTYFLLGRKKPLLTLEQARAMVLFHNTRLATESGVALDDVPPQYLPVEDRPSLPRLTALGERPETDDDRSADADDGEDAP